MAWYEFVWTEDNIQHLADNGVSPEQFEDVVLHANRRELSRTSGRPAARGYDDQGRLLFCVFEHLGGDAIYPVTAYEITD